MIDVNLIINVIIGMFIYNIILKAFGATLINQFMKSDVAKQHKKTYRQKIKEKLKDDEKLN
jgi:hypothetical protein